MRADDALFVSECKINAYLIGFRKERTRQRDYACCLRRIGAFRLRFLHSRLVVNLRVLPLEVPIERVLACN